MSLTQIIFFWFPRLNIHFIHIKPDVKDKTIIPLLLLHGWPGSIREFFDLFPLLTTANEKSDYVFEVIAPSLPGFGWSDGSAKTGFRPPDVATVLRNRMLRLGHTRFLIQGEDWGSLLGSDIATLYPDNVIGYHSNFLIIRTLLSTTKAMLATIWPTAFLDQKYVGIILFSIIGKI